MNKLIEYDLSHHPEWFYKDRDNNLYPQYRTEIQKIVDPYKPDTFLPILEKMDYPFLEDIWLDTLTYVILNGKELKWVFGKYIAKMRLKSFSLMRFKDSQYNKDILAYHPSISWEPITQEYLSKHEGMTYHNHKYAYWPIV